MSFLLHPVSVYVITADVHANIFPPQISTKTTVLKILRYKGRKNRIRDHSNIQKLETSCAYGI